MLRMLCKSLLNGEKHGAFGVKQDGASLEKMSRKITYTINGISLDVVNKFYQIDT